jgi:hypothetical protein
MSAKSEMPQATLATDCFVLAMQLAEVKPRRVALLLASADNPSLLELRPTSQPNV